MSEEGSPMAAPLVALIAGESSGDLLGRRLMDALRRIAPEVRFMGVGGPTMEAAGLKSLFPMSDIAVNGFLPVIRRLPSLLVRIDRTAADVARAKPDIVVHIDAQDFNKRVAMKLRKRLPDTPLVGYVAPTVWAWRPGRARTSAKLFRRLLAVLPFEPEAMARLGGPDTVYIGHPLMEQEWPEPKSFRKTPGKPPLLLLLPGSRQAEIKGLLRHFGEAVSVLAPRFPGLRLALPTVPHLATAVASAVENWPLKPAIITDEVAKDRVFRLADVALAASGTVVLELALAGVPTVAAYRVGRVQSEVLRKVLTTRYATLPNVILDRPLVPEFLGSAWNGEGLAGAVTELLLPGPAREGQLQGFAQIRQRMAVSGAFPSDRAAAEILSLLPR
ncbi:MAG: lipid-A-disaccharide synthase [Beijerinckiaceae bacterium]